MSNPAIQMFCNNQHPMERGADWCSSCGEAPVRGPAPPSNSPSCQDGKPCRTPPTGGACSQCGYPRAYAHPSSLLDAFRVDAIWIGGTAILVEPQRCIAPGLVRIFHSAGSFDEHLIPETTDEDLDVHVRRPLLLFAARLLCEETSTSRELSGALVDGLGAMSHGWLSPTQRELLEHFGGPPEVKSLVKRLLREVDQGDIREALHSGSLPR